MLRVPALRERSDLIDLAQHIVEQEAPGIGMRLADDVVALLRAHRWPGNLRQLFNVLRTAVALAANGREITRDHLSEDVVEEALAPRGNGTCRRCRRVATAIARRTDARGHRPRGGRRARQHLRGVAAAGHQPQHHLPQAALDGRNTDDVHRAYGKAPPWRGAGQRRYNPRMKPAEPTLRASGLTKRYGERVALDGVSITLQGGTFATLLGPNGAGKSTLFQVLTGLFVPDAGEIEVAGHSMRRAATTALRHIGVVFQQMSLDLDLTVRAQPAVPRRPARPAARRWRGARIVQGCAGRRAWATTSSARCASCRAATGARSNWCARCCTARRCC